jgi:hypothetical protein
MDAVANPAHVLKARRSRPALRVLFISGYTDRAITEALHPSPSADGWVIGTSSSMGMPGALTCKRAFLKLVDRQDALPEPAVTDRHDEAVPVESAM